jgi:hypothetical protein
MIVLLQAGKSNMFLWPEAVPQPAGLVVVVTYLLQPK